MPSNASHRSPGISYRPTAHQDARQHASKAKAHQGYLDALHKASCDLCGVSLGLLHTEGKMFDIRDPHFVFDLKVLCLPCTEAMESRLSKGIPEPVDLFGG
jgi:hypothetical protein